jgi:hypothetical protein
MLSDYEFNKVDSERGGRTMPTRFSFSRSKRLISSTSSISFCGSCSEAACSQSSIQRALSFIIFRVANLGPIPPRRGLKLFYRARPNSASGAAFVRAEEFIMNPSSAPFTEMLRTLAVDDAAVQIPREEL